jgi:hypothetical protein
MAPTVAASQISKTLTPADSIRIAELNQYFAELSRTVREGDFEGYKATYHQDAVCVFTTGEKKRSTPIDVQLALWKPGIDDTKAGKTKNNVEFRFSQRIGDTTSAHETGIFYFTSIDKNGKVLATGGVHFEILLVKRNGVWLALMEYQKSKATQEEWDALK